MKPGNGLYASGESMEREEEKTSVLTPIALGLAAVAAIAFGAAVVNDFAGEAEPTAEELQRAAYYDLLDVTRTDFEGGTLEMNGSNSFSHKSDTTTLVYDFSQNMAEKRFSTYSSVAFGGAGAGGLSAISFNEIANIEAVEQESCALAQGIKTYLEGTDMQYSFQRHTYDDVNAFFANHGAAHCAP
ncbi:MAG: hypothetical protein VXY16_09205 [Pseudomonadota bacterium]|nr:hypothetical protein [Pseudomonadota bacterium]